MEAIDFSYIDVLAQLIKLLLQVGSVSHLLLFDLLSLLLEQQLIEVDRVLDLRRELVLPVVLLVLKGHVFLALPPGLVFQNLPLEVLVQLFGLLHDLVLDVYFLLFLIQAELLHIRQVFLRYLLLHNLRVIVDLLGVHLGLDAALQNIVGALLKLLNGGLHGAASCLQLRVALSEQHGVGPHLLQLPLVVRVEHVRLPHLREFLLLQLLDVQQVPV